MLPLLNAIYSKFTGDSALTTAFTGGMHRDLAPEGTVMPYLVSHVATSRTHYAYGGAYRTETEIRFSAYAVGHDAAGLLTQTFLAHFDDSLLTLSAGTNDVVARVGDPLPKLHRLDAAGNDVWEWTTTYVYGVVG